MSSGKRKVYFEIDEDLLPVAGLAVVVTIDEEGCRGLRYLHLGDSKPWERLGWLEAARDREKGKMSGMWGWRATNEAFRSGLFSRRSRPHTSRPHT